MPTVTLTLTFTPKEFLTLPVDLTVSRMCRRALLLAFGDDAHTAMLLRLLHELSDSGLVSQVNSQLSLSASRQTSRLSASSFNAYMLSCVAFKWPMQSAENQC